MKRLMAHSVEQVERTSTETAESQIKEIKKLKYSEPHKFMNKANEDQHKFNTKVFDALEDASEHIETREPSIAYDAIKKGDVLLDERQKHTNRFRGKP